MLKILVIFFLFSLNILSNFDPDHKAGNSYQFINYGIKEGISQSTVLSSYQDDHGFIWLGTRDGLNRFDGYQFEIFRQIPGDTATIQDNHINFITGDLKGNIWVATNEGLSKYNLNQHYFHNFQLNISGTDPEIRTIFIHENGDIWVGSKDGIFQFDQKSGKFFKPNHILVDSVANQYVTTIFKDQQHNIWVGTTNGLYFYNVNHKKVYKFHNSLNDEYYISHPRIESIAQDEKGAIWVGTYGGGVNCLSIKSGYSFHLSTDNPNFSKLTNDFVRSLLVDNDNKIWIGTFEGLNVYNIAENQIEHIHHDFMKKDGLSHGSVRSLLKDQKGYIWIGTYMGGISYFDKDNQKFNHYYHIPEKRNSLSHNVVSDFAKDENGIYYIATERGGLNQFDSQTQSFSPVPNTQGITIKSLYFNNNQEIWLGTFKEGLWLYDIKSRKIKKFPGQSHKFSFLREANVNNIIVDKQGFLWIATDKDGGIFKFDKIKNQFIEFKLRSKLHALLKNSRVTSITQDQLGNIWLATHGEGIVLFNEADGNIKQFKQEKTSGSLNSNDINQIFPDREGSIWVATSGGGLNLFDRQKETFKAYTTIDKLQNNEVLGIMQDNSGFLWLACINGISRFNATTGKFNNYNYTNGLPLQEINEGAFYHDDQKKIFIGGSNGFISFSPDHLQENNYIPRVKITGMKLFNQPVFPGQSNKVLNKHIINTDTITLKHHQSIFTLEFAALNFLKPEQNHYEYRLDGLEDQWNEVGNTRYASYTNLKEGSYTFMVRAANNEGLWNEQTTNLFIIVKPPFWKTWWAMLIYVFVILSGLFIMRQISHKSARMRNEIRFREMENAKLEEIHRLKLESFTDVSHEFRTPLTLIIDPLEQILEKKTEDSWLKKQLSLMHFNARRLLLLINQILEISELEAGNIALKFEPTNLQRMVENICISFQGLAEKHQVAIDFIHDMPDELLQVDRDKLEKIIYNLISNAIKFNKPKGFVSVELHPINENTDGILVEIKVVDNGIGVNQELKSRVFERFYKGTNTKGTGIGLALTKSLTEVLGGKIDLMSQPELGATFIVKLLFKKSKKLLENQVHLSKPLPVEYDLQLFSEEEHSQPDNDSGKPTILLIEDDKDLKQYMKDNLSIHYRVITAKDGLRGLEKTKKENPELIMIS